MADLVELGGALLRLGCCGVVAGQNLGGELFLFQFLPGGGLGGLLTDEQVNMKWFTDLCIARLK